MCESNHISDNILWFVFPLLLINLVLQVIYSAQIGPMSIIILVSDWSTAHNTHLWLVH